MKHEMISGQGGNLQQMQEAYQKELFLNGQNNMQSLKHRLENEVIEMKFRNAQLEKEMNLKSELASNEIADINYTIMLL